MCKEPITLDKHDRHNTTKGGWDIQTRFIPEDTAPDFEDGEGKPDKEIHDKIANGSLAWFRVEVHAMKRGLSFASDHLGGCCYDTYEGFIEAGDYWPDMVDNVIIEARKVLEEIIIDTAHKEA